MIKKEIVGELIDLMTGERAPRYGAAVRLAVRFFVSHVRRLPVDPAEIMRQMGWTVVPYHPSHLAAIAAPVASDFRRIKDVLESTDAHVSVREDGILVLYNVTRPAARIRFSLAHEIGHVLLSHDHEDISREFQLEREADVFARNLIAPPELVRRVLESVPENDPVQTLVDVFGLSRHAARVRLDRLGVDIYHAGKDSIPEYVLRDILFKLKKKRNASLAR